MINLHKFVKIKKKLILFAGVNPNKTINSLKKELLKIKKLGFRGIKLHPRLSEFYLDHKNLSFILKECRKIKFGFNVMLL